MSEVINFEDMKQKGIVERIKKGEIFIYPTDTVYSLGCNALNENSVQAILNLAGDNKVNIIAPNKRWVYNHFEIVNKSFIRKLPGPYTYILKAKKRAVAKNFYPGENILRIRIPDHKFATLIKRTGIPVLSLDIYVDKNKAVRELRQVPKKFLKLSDFALDAGYLHNYPSTLIDLTSEIPKLIKR